MTGALQGEFSLSGYRDLIENFLARGYAVRDFEAADPSAKDLILRHDIDMSIDAARRLARIERDCGVSGSYFVLMRSGLYNPWSAASCEALHDIMGMGHAVGLHFDASLYPEDRASLDRACASECSALETVLDAPVTMVSFHRPSAVLLADPDPVGGRAHTYQPRFFTDIGYCSDSQGAWRFGHPLEHEAACAGSALQLLTHPIWWQEDPASGPVETLDRFVARHQSAYRDELAANCKPYAAALSARRRQTG